MRPLPVGSGYDCVGVAAHSCGCAGFDGNTVLDDWLCRENEICCGIGILSAVAAAVAACGNYAVAATPVATANVSSTLCDVDSSPDHVHA